VGALGAVLPLNLIKRELDRLRADAGTVQPTAEDFATMRLVRFEQSDIGKHISVALMFLVIDRHDAAYLLYAGIRI
jgi:hypothetical protein